MSLDIQWDHPARVVLLEQIAWPTSAAVAHAVHRFAALRAPGLPSGRYGVRAAGYELALRVDHVAGVVLVLHLYRR